MKLPDIKVVNQKRTKEGEYIGRPSPLGNPYGWTEDVPKDLRVEDRETAIRCYQSWLESHMRTQTPRIIQELDRLAIKAMKDGSLTLRCWCAPLACHGDIVKAALLEAIQNHLEEG